MPKHVRVVRVVRVDRQEKQQQHVQTIQAATKQNMYRNNRLAALVEVHRDFT